MKTSCGIIILNEKEEILMGHVTGNKFFDIPKGMLEEGEEPINCALRECQEETSIAFNSQELKDIGLHAYNKEKNLYLFICYRIKDSINLEQLKCNSFFEHFYTKKLMPEVDGFNWISIDDVDIHCAKSMGKLLNKLKKEHYFEKNVKKLGSSENRIEINFS